VINGDAHWPNILAEPGQALPHDMPVHAPAQRGGGIAAGISGLRDAGFLRAASQRAG